MKLGRDEGGWGLSVYLAGLHLFTYFFTFFFNFFYPRHFNSFPNIEMLACQGEKKTCEVPKGLSGDPVFCGSAFQLTVEVGEGIGTSLKYFIEMSLIL